MTAVGKAMGRVVGEIRPAAQTTSLTPFAPPALPVDLQQQVDLLSGQMRFGDFAMTAPKPAFHPDAARYAGEWRQGLQPVPPATITAWFGSLAGLVGRGAVDAEMLLRGVVLSCGKLPAVCWTAETLGEAVGKFTFLPMVAELKAFLEPFAMQLRARVAGLDRVARADPATASNFRTGPAREAKGYVLPPPPPQREARVPLHPSGKEIAAPLRSVEEQLAALGFTRETVPPLERDAVP
jgi:hypothetical protein